jgi:alpha-galactosidase
VGQKITIIGGGSSTFVPHLLRLFMQSATLKSSTITLMDVDARRLEVMETLARRLIEKEEADLTVRSSTEQRTSLVGADFVIVAIAVGGLAAWEADVEISGRYGVFTEIHDSIGPGGIMRAFRHVPVLASICADLEEVSPHA